MPPFIPRLKPVGFLAEDFVSLMVVLPAPFVPTNAIMPLGIIEKSISISDACKPLDKAIAPRSFNLLSCIDKNPFQCHFDVCAH